MPVAGQSWVMLPDSIEPGLCPGWLASQPLELLHGPANEVFVDAHCEGVQLGAVEGSVLVDPASNLGVDGPGEVGQGAPGATTQMPTPDLPADRFLALGLMAGKNPTKVLGGFGPGEPGSCSRGSRSSCARTLRGGGRLCSRRSWSSRGGARALCRAMLASRGEMGAAPNEFALRSQ